ncbi:BnaCnng77860D [Brassica napus]|uniref:BnaCnng77860D protein n=1 Tax=Brassica napus TaxID=3708 RepID=A0A078K0L5_BRANA|nr:BnaCnng77860D [Brassica napus]
MSFIDFVDRVLAVSSDSTIRRFSMIIRRSVEPAHINRWMINVLSRGILDLGLDTLTKDVITMPLEIFTCKTIVKLKLGSLVKFAMVPENAYLPSLKTLFLVHVRFSGCEFEALLSACPVLEELTLLGCPWDPKQCLTISCTTLERLTLSYEYPIVNLHSLVEAKLSLEFRGSPNESNPMNLINGLRNVEVLDLSSLETSKLLFSFSELIPLFEKLSRVSIATEVQHACWSWKFLPLLLKKSPNLKTLVIKGPLHFYDEYGEESEPLICECLSEYSFLSSCHVKILEIIDYCGTKGEMGQMKKFLEKLPCLELVNIHASAKAKLTFCTDLQVLPRAGNIQLKFFSFQN